MLTFLQTSSACVVSLAVSLAGQCANLSTTLLLAAGRGLVQGVGLTVQRSAGLSTVPVFSQTEYAVTLATTQPAGTVVLTPVPPCVPLIAAHQQGLTSADGCAPVCTLAASAYLSLAGCSVILTAPVRSP